MSDSVQLSNLGSAPDKLYLQRRDDIETTAASFRDISDADAKKERNIKIAMVVSAVILFIVTIVAVSEIAKLSPIERWLHNRRGEIFLIYEYPAFTAIVPGLLGTAGVIGLAAGAAAVNLENNGYLRNLSKEGAVEHELFILTSENLEGVHKNYHQRMQPLVRKGLISEDEGRQLSALLESYHVTATKKASYESRGEAFKADLKDHPEKYPAYNILLGEIAQFEGQWMKLQKTVQERYSKE